MTQKQIVGAYRALEHLSRQALPIKTAYAMHKMRGKLKPLWDFQVEQEQKLLEELKPTPDGDDLVFASPEDSKRWLDLLKDLAEIETDIKVDPIDVVMTDDMKVSMVDIEALDGFINFIE